MSLSFQRLSRPHFLVGSGQRAPSALAGLRNAGPYQRGDCPTEPRILFVFPDELRDEANRLFVALKNGIGPFRGTEPLLGYRLLSSNVERLPPFSVAGLSDEKAARIYQQAIEARLSRGDLRADLALVIHRKTDRTDQENPYLRSKFPLLRSNIPTQAVTEELLERTDTFQWSAANIALAMFVKMGGIPWAVETELSEDSLIVGINRVFVSGSRYFGFASTFAHNGIYRGTRLFAPARGWNAYLAGLDEAIRSALGAWRDDIGAPMNLVVHLRKELGRDERMIIERCLADAGSDFVRAWAAVKLVDSDHIALFDEHDEAATPPAGVMVRLAGHRALLQIPGKEPDVSGFGRVVNAGPWHVTRLAYSPGAPPLDVLCANILALSAMNWSGLNAEAAPVTIRYPGKVSELLGRFVEAGFDVAQLQQASIFRRAWFI